MRKTQKPKVWIVKCHDGQVNDTWEITADSRQEAKDAAAVRGAYSTHYLTAKLKK